MFWRYVVRWLLRHDTLEKDDHSREGTERPMQDMFIQRALNTPLKPFHATGKGQD